MLIFLKSNFKILLFSALFQLDVNECESPSATWMQTVSTPQALISAAADAATKAMERTAFVSFQSVWFKFNASEIAQ